VFLCERKNNIEIETVIINMLKFDTTLSEKRSNFTR